MQASPSHARYAPGQSWAASLTHLRNQVTEPAALSNAATLLSARDRWFCSVEASTSGNDLKFCLPLAVAPDADSVTVRWVAGVSHLTRFAAGRPVDETTATPDTVHGVLDGFLERLVHPRLVCRACGEVVELNADRFDIFEQMHYTCFHYEFEHSGDRDQECDAGGCPAELIGPRPFPDVAGDLLTEEIVEALRGSRLANADDTLSLDILGSGTLTVTFGNQTYLITIRDIPQLH
jgi:hypothetical protein